MLILLLSAKQQTWDLFLVTVVLLCLGCSVYVLPAFSVQLILFIIVPLTLLCASIKSGVRTSKGPLCCDIKVKAVLHRWSCTIFFFSFGFAESIFSHGQKELTEWRHEIKQTTIRAGAAVGCSWCQQLSCCFDNYDITSFPWGVDSGKTAFVLTGEKSYF